MEGESSMLLDGGTQGLGDQMCPCPGSANEGGLSIETGAWLGGSGSSSSPSNKESGTSHKDSSRIGDGRSNRG